MPFVTVSGGATTVHPKRNHLFLARSLGETQTWRRWITPNARKALRYVDFNRYGVVVALRLQRSTGLRIRRIAVAGHTLGLWLNVPKAPPPDPTIVTVGAFHVVAIERKYLRPVSRLVVRGLTVY